MKRYRFPLDQVLRVRRIEEDQAAGRLASARAEAVAAVARHDGRQAALAAMHAPSGAVDAARFLAWHDLVGRAGDALRAAAVVREEAAQAAEERRAEYIAAKSKTSALERLDERRRDDHRRENLRDEAKLLDDLVTSRRARDGEHQ